MSSNNDDDDDLFTSLGGSLMKELLADLQDDDDGGWLSLEQLEQELSSLEKPTFDTSAAPTNTNTAASMVVARQPPEASTTTIPVMDAWSLSLQKFTAASLEQEFLQADSQRRQQEQLPVQPPPGLLASPSTNVEIPKPAPPTPQNSIALLEPTPTPHPTPQTKSKTITPAIAMIPPITTMPIVYCHPQAPYIPTDRLTSRYMNTRDVNFVIHSILRPIPPPNQYDYHTTWLRRQGQTSAMLMNTAESFSQELASRHAKAKEWSQQQHVLGLTAKTNITRPRSLIQQVAATPTQNNARAALWKARLYIDQAYQAWHEQLSLQKLAKCCGFKAGEVVDPEILALLLKLPKGRVLLARLWEQAVFPPQLVQTILPVAITAWLDVEVPDLGADTRLASAMCRLMDSQAIFAGVWHAVGQSLLTRQALRNATTMQVTHYYLRRASQQPEWNNEMEQEFLKLLS